MQKKLTRTLLILAMGVTLIGWRPAAGAQDSENARKPADASSPSATAAKTGATTPQAELTVLQKQVVQQQAQIDQLLRSIQQLKEKLDASNSAPSQEPVRTSDPGLNASLAPVIPPTPPPVPTPSSAPAPPASSPAPKAQGMTESAPESPLQLKIGSASITPVGFMDFTGVFRTKEAGGNIGTSFGSIPYATLSSGLTPVATNLSELRMSIQNSRIGFRADADVKGAHVIGYMEADFLGTPASTNVAVTSNSQLLRARLYWVDVRRGGWELMGGQTWSLITPGREGISPLPSNVFYTQDMDVNYQAGLVWGRIPELRLVYHLPSDKAAFAIAIDSPDQYAGGSSGGGTITFPAALSSTYGCVAVPVSAGGNNVPGTSCELDTGTTSGGISSPNVAPDIIAKLAFDPAKRVHFEIGGVERNFKVYNPGAAAVAATSTTPAVPAVAPQTFSMQGGGGFVNLHVELFKGFRLMTNNFWSAAGGRYIFGQAPDVIVHADGSLSPVHSGSTVTGFEATAKKTMLFGYYGGIYIMRNTAIDTTGKLIGYGYSGSGNGQNRSIQEITFGFNQTIWKNAKWGAINMIGQYSYLVRDPWYVNFATRQPPNATNNMVFLDLRYTLPGSAPTLGKN